LGFVSIYDRDRDQFAHPAAAFVIAPDGRLVPALPGLVVDPLTLRLAIIDAGNGAIGTWTDHIRLLRYGYDPANGICSVAIGRILVASGVATIVVLALLIGLLLRLVGLYYPKNVLNCGLDRAARAAGTVALERFLTRSKKNWIWHDRDASLDIQSRNRNMATALSQRAFIGG
jgi:hypothetical protein